MVVPRREFYGARPRAIKRPARPKWVISPILPAQAPAHLLSVFSNEGVKQFEFRERLLELSYFTPGYRHQGQREVCKSPPLQAGQWSEERSRPTPPRSRSPRVWRRVPGNKARSTGPVDARSFEHRLQSPKSVPAFSPLARRAGRVRAR